MTNVLADWTTSTGTHYRLLEDGTLEEWIGWQCATDVGELTRKLFETMGWLQTSETGVIQIEFDYRDHHLALETSGRLLYQTKDETGKPYWKIGDWESAIADLLVRALKEEL